MTFHVTLTARGLRWLRSIFRWMFLSCFTAPGLSMPASSAELLSEQWTILPLCPLRALYANKPFRPPSSSFHLCSLWALWTTLCVPSSPPALAISIQYIYLTTCSLSLPLSLSAMWAGDPLNPLYPSLPSTWLRADYILDITVPDVSD